MSLTATDKGNAEFEMTPEGSYVARCYKIIDMGTQTTTGQYGIKDQHKVMVSWELLDDPKMQDGRPFSVSQFYTVSLHEKAKLRADLEAWRGKKFTAKELEGFDLGSVIGAYCMIQVVHDETGKYANVQAIMSYKGEKPAPVNPNVVFDIDNPDMDIFNALSDNMKAKITSAPEWRFNNQLPVVKEPVTVTATAEKPDTVHLVNEDEPIDLNDIPF
jgi:hypothetical protein